MKKECNNNCRLAKVGGQAVLEGVMMKAGKNTVTTCRKEDGSLVVTNDSFVSVRQKHKFLNIPILRGVINFIEMLILSFKTLDNSAKALGIDEESEGKFEKWLKKHFGASVTDFIMVIALILGLALSVFLFLLLPIWICAGINYLLTLAFNITMAPWVSSIVEGLIKVAIFIVYLALVSLMPEIKRTFMYHGAEHKSIACFEAGEELTPENAKKHTRFHPRCGTSFMFFMILIGIFAGIIIKTLIPGVDTWIYTVIRLLILPLVMGVGYEFIMFAGKHDNAVVRILSAPGLWVQRITTKEPDLSMLEVAIISLKCALRDEYPEFMEFYNSRPWEKKAEAEPTNNEEAENDAEALTDEDNTETDGAAKVEETVKTEPDGASAAEDKKEEGVS